MSFPRKIGEVRVVEGRSAVFCSLEWRVQDFLSLPAEEDVYWSPNFDACGADWYFLIYPKGRDREDAGRGGWVELGLRRWRWSGLVTKDSLHASVAVKGEGGVRNEIGITKEFSDDDCECWWYNFCSRDLLEEEASTWMPGGALTLAIEFRRVPLNTTETSTQTAEVAEELEKHQCPYKQDAEELAESFRGLLAEGEDSDVLLRVRDKEFPAHTLILRARSPVFRAMFAHDMVERQSGVVKMGDCDPESFPAFLEHVYTGSTRVVSAGNVFALYVASDMYDLRRLKEVCTKFLKSHLTVSCFCDAIALALRHDEEELVELATEYFCSNAFEIVKTDEWQIFLKENSTIANELLIKAFSQYA